jgi:hypothetical protein
MQSAGVRGQLLAHCGHGTRAPMRSLIGWLVASVLGGIGWWLGGVIGIGTALLLSSVGSAVGLWAGFRWFDENLK